MSCNKSGSRRVPIQHYFEKKLESKLKSRNIFYLISKMSCNKSGSRRVPIQHYFEKKLESKEKSRNIFYLISKMSCNKSGSRRVPIQHYFEKYWNRKKNHGISSILSAKCPATNLAAGEYQYSTILKKIGIGRKITEYLLFDQQNVLQQIWQPESTNTPLSWKNRKPKEKSRNIFYLISKMSCNKSGSRRVPVQNYFEKN